MQLKTFTAKTHLANNSYLVIDDFTNECAIIDAPINAQEIVDYVSQNNLTVKYILLTHHHFDHTEGLPILEQAFPAAEVTQKSASIGMIDIQSIPTPGHTTDGTSFYISHEQTLFSGDTLFKEEIGRTDLEDGNFNEELSSIQNKLFALPPHTKVYPGHGPFTTIEWEINNNPYFK